MSRHKSLHIAGAAVLLMALSAAVAPSGVTYAAWSDFAAVPVTAGAGVWLAEGDPPLPAQCAGILFDRIIVGTNKSDTLTGTAGDDLIFGLQGKDVLHGLEGQDCLVGGSGKDQLFGEDGDDVLVGGNAKDALNGGPDDDVCDGGRGNNTLVACEFATAILFSTSASASTESDSVLVAPEPESTDLLLTDPSPETGSGAFVEDPPEAPLAETAALETVDPGVEQPADGGPTEVPVAAAVEVQP